MSKSRVMKLAMLIALCAMATWVIMTLGKKASAAATTTPIPYEIVAIETDKLYLVKAVHFDNLDLGGISLSGSMTATRAFEQGLRDLASDREIIGSPVPISTSMGHGSATTALIVTVGPKKQKELTPIRGNPY